MKKYKFFARKLFLILSLTFYVAVNAQNKPLLNDSAIPKVIKNHFFPQYPDDFFFIQCGLQDKAGNMWFGSAGDGVYCYDGKSFTNYTTNDGLCHNDVLCILEDKAGSIWFGTRGGACRYTPKAGKTAKKNISSFPIYSNGNNNLSQSKSRYSSGFSNNFVWCMLQDRNGKIWFGTNDGVFLYDPITSDERKKPVVVSFLNNDEIVNGNSLHLKTVQKIIEDKHGNIWFASGDLVGEGICVYDGKSVINFKPDSVASFKSILETKDGNLLFLSLNKGIFKASENIRPVANTTFINYTDSIGLKNYLFTAMLEDKNGNLWFGTAAANEGKEDTGAWRYDSKSLKLFTTNDGLSNNSVFCIVEDNRGNIWFGTRNTGLCCYDWKSFKDFTDNQMKR